MRNSKSTPASSRGVFWALPLLVVSVLGASRTADAGDSALGDPALTGAMEVLSTGTLGAAREALTKLEEGLRARPDNALYLKLRGEIEILFRAEFAVGQAQEVVAKAAGEAEKKEQSAKLAMEPSKLSGRNDPIAAARYRNQALEIVATAAAAKDQTVRDFGLAVARAKLLALDMLADGEDTAALGLGNALSAVAARNGELLRAEDGSAFTPAISRVELEDIEFRVKARQAMVKKGVEMESAGQKEAALDFYERAGYAEGVRRLGGGVK